MQSSIPSNQSKKQKAMSRWIFQDIKDLQSKYLYAKQGPADLDKRSAAYNKALREKIDPEIYVRYLIWTFDIYIDVAFILIKACDVYGKAVTPKIVSEWIEKHKEPHHVLTQLPIY